MSENQINWEPNAQSKFKQLIAKIPAVLQGFAQDKISKRAEKLVLEAGRSEITEKDMVDAFFAETPFGFHGPMKCDMDDLGVDYVKYGYEK